MSFTPRSTLGQIPSGVWVLGFVSLLMDISSEMIHSLLPLFMVTTLGASALVVGLIEGLAEATALMVKVFSGALSDYLGRRKGLAVFGYALGALTKPVFALASGTGFVLAARLLDRIGKGVRGAPRDALIADIAPPEIRGAAFGLRQSLDTVGAFVGPLLAFGNPKSPCRNNAATRSAATTCAGWAAPTGGWSGSADCLLWPVSARPFSSCVRSRSALRWRSCRWSWSR